MRVTRAGVVAIARRWIGTPYHHQASLAGAGCDCLGLVRGVWREVFGAEPEVLPGYSGDWAEASGREALLEAARRHLVERSPAELRTGDVAVFRLRPGCVAKHAGILTGSDCMIHAQEGVSVSEVPLSAWWVRHVAAVFSFPGIED